MATISFANLDQSVDITDASSIEFAALSGLAAGFSYSYVSTGGDDWEFAGTGITNAGAGPTGGAVTGVSVDLDDDAPGLFEIVITGLGGVAAASFGVGIGTAAEQRDKFWAAALGGADTINFTMVSFRSTHFFAGDGAKIHDGAVHIGAADSFVDGGTALTGSQTRIAGDYFDVVNGSAVGGNDTMSIGGFMISGDFISISPGATGVGGDDFIQPLRLANIGLGFFVISGDADSADGTLIGGNDLIDLRLVDMTGVTDLPGIYGDARQTFNSSLVIAGNDTIHGSSRRDFINGDTDGLPGYIEGGKDRLFGYGGNDSIIGGGGRDQLFGGDGDDTLNGGLDGDIIDGGIGNDNMTGDAGNDIMTGGDGNDTMIAGSGSDTVDGGIGDDAADAGAGADVMIGGTGKDGLFGGTGNDSISGDAGNDTLQGGDQNDTLLGGAGFDVLLGGNDNDTLDGGASNDILFGNAGNDTFVFSKGSATDTIRDMAAGASVADVINLVGFGAAFDTFAEVMAAATDNGTDTTINFGNGDVLIIQNVTVAGFNANDFIFG